MQLSKEELLKQIREGDIPVLVVGPGAIPHDKVTWKSVPIQCDLCQGEAHMDAANQHPAETFIKVCLLCFFAEGLLNELTAPPSSMVQGEMMKFEEGFEVVKAMITGSDDPTN